MFRYAHLALIIVLVLPASIAQAYRTGIAVGAVGVGSGHSNATDPTAPLSYKLHFTNRNDFDFGISITHLVLGRVFDFKSGAFIIPAAGYIVAENGSGPGVSATFGYTFFCLGLCLSAEFQHQLGIGPQRALLSGYSTRFGLDYTSE
ncbi:MAG: hypothetical protein RIR26_1674, partial [Pseudomonadota bacterium]